MLLLTPDVQPHALGVGNVLTSFLKSAVCLYSSTPLSLCSRNSLMPSVIMKSLTLLNLPSFSVTSRQLSTAPHFPPRGCNTSSEEQDCLHTLGAASRLCKGCGGLPRDSHLKVKGNALQQRCAVVLPCSKRPECEISPVDWQSA